MLEAVRTSETLVDNHFTRQYNPEDSSERHTLRRENLKSHNTSNVIYVSFIFAYSDRLILTLCVISSGQSGVTPKYKSSGNDK
jgi:hypothetical protein